MANARKIATAVARRLQKHGHIGVFAGGCVRDRFLGATPKDFDVATNATPEQVLAIFKRDTVLTVGAAFGVVIVVRQGVQIEIATLRGDGQYSDGRRPESVVFLSHLSALEALKGDAARRDLTINAMFEDPVSGVIHDFFGGEDDIKNRVLRAVGDASERFGEDRLRMLRVVRFAAKLGFAVEASLMAALKKHAPDLKAGVIVSWERIANELEGVLMSKAPVVGLELLMQTGLMAEILPEMMPMTSLAAMQDPYWHPEGTAWTHTCMVVAELAKCKEKSFALMLGGLLHDIAKPATQSTRADVKDGVTILRISNRGHAEKGAVVAKAICQRYKLSADTTRRVSEIVRMHMQMHDFNDPSIKRSKLVRLMQRDDILDLIRMQHADVMGTGRPEQDRLASSHREFYLGLMDEFNNDPSPSRRTNAQELLNGKVIKEMGFKPGPIFRVIKECATNAQYEGEFTDVEGAKAWLSANTARFNSMSRAEIDEIVYGSDFIVSGADNDKHCC